MLSDEWLPRYRLLENFNTTSSPKGNDRSPESQHVIIKTNSDMNKGMLPCCQFAKNNYLQYQEESCQ